MGNSVECVAEDCFFVAMNALNEIPCSIFVVQGLLSM